MDALTDRTNRLDLEPFATEAGCAHSPADPTSIGMVSSAGSETNAARANTNVTPTKPSLSPQLNSHLQPLQPALRTQAVDVAGCFGPALVTCLPLPLAAFQLSSWPASQQGRAEHGEKAGTLLPVSLAPLPGAGSGHVRRRTYMRSRTATGSRATRQATGLRRPRPAGAGRAWMARVGTLLRLVAGRVGGEGAFGARFRWSVVYADAFPTFLNVCERTVVANQFDFTTCPGPSTPPPPPRQMHSTRSCLSSSRTVEYRNRCCEPSSSSISAPL